MTLEKHLDSLETFEPFKITETEIKVNGVVTYLLREFTSKEGKTRNVLHDLKGYKVSETLFNGDKFHYQRDNGKLIIRHYNAESDKTYVTSQDHV